MTRIVQFPDLAGKRAMVTGASGRLGSVWVQALLEAGVSVLGVDKVEPTPTSALGRLAAQWEATWQFAQADITDRTGLEQACEPFLGEGIDILVNNAGIDQPPGPGQSRRIEDWPAAEFQAVLAVNLAGAFQVSQVVAPAMTAATGGSIINIGSLYATVSPEARNYDHLDPPFVKPPAYGASKAGLHNLTRYLAAHWGDRGIRVNTLSPGGIAGGQDPEFVRKFTERVPLRRLGEHQDLVAPLLFLASQASSYITGQDLPVDGGYTLW